MGINRNLSVDIAKALCIILVVMGHFNPDYSPASWIMIHDILYTFHMPVFMFASGFVYMLTRKPDVSYGKFLLGKVRRLLVPYFVTSVIIITIKLFTEHSMAVESPVTLMSYLKIFYYPEAGYFLWFIWALWWLFVIVGLCSTKRQQWILTAVALVVHFLPFDPTKVFAINSIKYMSVYFMGGVMLCHYRHVLPRIYRLPNYFVYGLFLAFAVAFVGVTDPAWKYALNQLLSFYGVIVVVYLSHTLAERHNRMRDGLLTVASCSYIIYLFHTTFEGFMKSVLVRLLGIPDSGMVFFGVALLVVGVGIAAPMILQLYVLDKFKVTQTLFGLKKHAKRSKLISVDLQN